MERVISLEIGAGTRWATCRASGLLLEAMGKSANFILTGGDGLIVDCSAGELRDRGEDAHAGLYTITRPIAKPGFFYVSVGLNGHC
jgi:hypothetical protein